MTAVPPTTDDIILDRAVHGTDCQRCVDWAIGMLIAGHDTDYLGRLAGQIPPFDMDSISMLRDRALEELGFEDLSSQRLICCLIANSLYQLRKEGLSPQGILESAKHLYVVRDIIDLEPLYLLSHGLSELEEYGDQWYVDDMTPSNTPEITTQIVDEFIKLHAQSP